MLLSLDRIFLLVLGVKSFVLKRQFDRVDISHCVCVCVRARAPIYDRAIHTHIYKIKTTVTHLKKLQQGQKVTNHSFCKVNSTFQVLYARDTTLCPNSANAVGVF